jgi:hypothetical protein
MEIASTSLALASWRQASESLEIRERSEWRSGSRRAAPEPSTRVALSRTAVDSPAESPETDEAADGTADPRLRLLRAVIEWLTGEAVAVFDARELDPGRRARLPRHPEPGSPAADAPAVTRELQVHYHEAEITRFEAAGLVRTRDGREIRFAVRIEMQRDFEIRLEARLRNGAAERKDPLVINFGGAAAELSDQRFRLDIDLDGRTDEARFVGTGSGFLVFDRNANGQVDDGSELFGARSGNGFAELAALDVDGNGWVDGGDTDFGRLRAWRLDAGGAPALESLSDAGIGALSTQSIDTPFALRTADNTPLAQFVASGVYLRQEGSAGSVQQLDLFV